MSKKLVDSCLLKAGEGLPSATMTDQTARAKAKLATLAASLDDLDAHIQPLFSQTLPETILALEPLQQAKLQTVLPYIIYDLVFIYLKSKGIDPKTHSVVPELDRVRKYFDKISQAEKEPTPRAEIDKEAAGRFIKHAIAQAKNLQHSGQMSPNPSSSTIIEPKITSKMLQRQQYEKELRESAENGELDQDILEVYEDPSMDVDDQSSSLSNVKGKGKEVTSLQIESQTLPSTKRKRPPIDPFAGYDDGNSQRTSSKDGSPSADSASTKASSSRKKRQKKVDNSLAADSLKSQNTPRAQQLASQNSSSANSPSPDPEKTSTKKAKKKAKRQKQSLTTQD